MELKLLSGCPGVAEIRWDAVRKQRANDNLSCLSTLWLHECTALLRPDKANEEGRIGQLFCSMQDRVNTLHIHSPRLSQWSQRGPRG